jgi:hypothetical protein
MKKYKPKTKQPAHAIAKPTARRTTNPKKSKATVVRELAAHFEQDLNKTLLLSIQPDGSVVYKNYLVKLTELGNWGLYNIQGKHLIDQYYLKTSAVMAAKAYNSTNLIKFFEIKQLDQKYWANYSDTLVYKINIKNAKDFDRFQVLLNKLEHTEFLTEHYKEKISVMFKWSFV